VEITLIAAMAANRVIGRRNAIPWHIPGEQSRFRRTTWGHTLIMGRRTHESIGRPLPGRRNIVVSRSPDYRPADGCLIAHSLQEAYSLCPAGGRVFNIGGEQLYRQGIGHAHTLILTILPHPVPGDAFFPEFSPADFRLTGQHTVTAPFPYTIHTYSRSPR
jgi:dihydrofolate reductase